MHTVVILGKGFAGLTPVLLFLCCFGKLSNSIFDHVPPWPKRHKKNTVIWRI